MKFYSVQYWSDIGPHAEHFTNKREAMRCARLNANHMGAQVYFHQMKLTSANVIIALNHCSNLATDGATWLPGDVMKLVETVEAKPLTVKQQR